MILAGKTRLSVAAYTILCGMTGAALVLVLGADVPRDTVPPNLDSAAQRLRIQDELSYLNIKMDELLLLLRSGQIKVVCVSADTDTRGLEHARTREPICVPPRGTPPSGHAR